MFIGITLDNRKFLFDEPEDIPDMFFPGVDNLEYYDGKGVLRESFWDLPKYEPPRETRPKSNRRKSRKP